MLLWYSVSAPDFREAVAELLSARRGVRALWTRLRSLRWRGEREAKAGYNHDRGVRSDRCRLWQALAVRSRGKRTPEILLLLIFGV